MNRTTRTLIVLAVAIAVASAATYFVFSALKNRPTEKVEVATAFAVVAAKPLPVGTRVKAEDVKIVPWPAAAQIPGSFTTIEQVIDRGVVSPVAENEPLSGNNIATKDVGAGLPALIPSGMRAISVRVNEVVGVAGFVVSGTRVDVMVILREGNDSLARVVVNNVLVLTTDAKYDQSAAKAGNAINSSVVTVLVSPTDAEKISLAAASGQIMLTLRNPLDTAPSESRGTRTAGLVADGAPAPVTPAAPRTPVVRKPAAAPAPPPPTPKIYTIETIRAAKRSEEPIK